MNRDLRLPFDPDFCFKVARAASMVCVAWLAMELTLLIAVQPASGICPGWTIHPGQPSQTKAWFLMLMFTAAPALWICFVVLRWRHFAEKFFNAILAYPALTINYNLLFVAVCAGWAVFCSLPLLIALSNCTTLLQPLGF